MQLLNQVIYLLLVTLIAFFFCLGCPFSLLCKLFEINKTAVIQSPTTELRCHSRVHYQSCTGLLWLMVVLFDTGDYHALVSKKYSC